MAAPVIETIPGLLAAALERDPGATWLRADDGTLTFGGAAAQVARLAERLRDAGVRRGDLVVVTARTTPPYVLCWLALASLGAVTVCHRPQPARSTSSPVSSTRCSPGSIVTDAALRPLVVEASGQPRSRGARP